MSIKLRQYKKCDGNTIAGWIKSERALRMWSSDRYGDFPITADDINKKYYENNGDCDEADNFYPFVAFDDEGLIGHLIMRYVDKSKSTVRLGYIIVDDERRGQGYGKKMLQMAVAYAFDYLGAERITLGVFEINESAYGCYSAVGFKETGEISVRSPYGEDWRFIEMEITR